MQSVTLKQSFTHTVSKGSRYNQIYVPRDLEKDFEAGDIVEVKLLKKKEYLHYSKSLKKLNEFKEHLVREILKSICAYKEIKQAYIIGSFLTTKEEYHDIDIVIISEKEIDERVQANLTGTYSLRFHVISVKEDALAESLKHCPLTRSMFYYYVSNKKGIILPLPELNKNHIRFLLMFPEDILEIDVQERMLYDSLRRVITIEAFLKKEEIAPDKIDTILKSRIESEIIERIKTEKKINQEEREEVKKMIRKKLKNIYTILNHEQKKS